MDRNELIKFWKLSAPGSADLEFFKGFFNTARYRTISTVWLVSLKK